MRLNKKFVILLAFVSLFLCIITVQDTYAKYVSHVSNTTDISIARWRILLNDFDVRNDFTSSSLITPVLNGNNYIASGVIAPTATGYFDIEIDSTDTDVAFTYSITIANNNNSLVNDIIITSCTLNGQSVSHTNGTITGSVPLNSASKVQTLHVNIQWNDSTGQTMDNAADTLTTTNANSVAKIDVTAHFVQTGSSQ